MQNILKTGAPMENSVVVSGSPWPMHWRDAERVCVKWQNQANPFTGFYIEWNGIVVF